MRYKQSGSAPTAAQTREAVVRRLDARTKPIQFTGAYSICPLLDDRTYKVEKQPWLRSCRRNLMLVLTVLRYHMPRLRSHIVIRPICL